MVKFFLFAFGFLVCSVFSFAQPLKGSNLFVIDSIPLLQDPQPWNPITAEDISDVSVVTDCDSLKLLGWNKVESITYVFTKAYRQRPDSIRRIPSLYQMKLERDQWLLNGVPYTGRFITYYNNGQRFDEGTMVDGRKEGWFIVQYQNGEMSSFCYYKDGLMHGEMNAFYKTGALKMKKWYEYGSPTGREEKYFLNGQVENAWRPGVANADDTLVTYFSSGKIKRLQVLKNGTIINRKHDENLDRANALFYQALSAGDLKEANRRYDKMRQLDSAATETQMAEAVLMAREFRFKEAIAGFDKVLTTEPLMARALLLRGLSRIRSRFYSTINPYAKDFKEPLFTVNDLLALDPADQQKVCDDLLLADALDTTGYTVRFQIGDALLNHCRMKKDDR